MIYLKTSAGAFEFPNQKKAVKSRKNTTFLQNISNLPMSVSNASWFDSYNIHNNLRRR